MPDLDPTMLWTARVAALGYAASVGLLLADRDHAWSSATRAAYTAGCVTLWVHVGLAFHSAHGWSHASAVRHTAEQTAAMVGVASGAGVYLNYLFMAVWAADAAYWWGHGHVGYRRRSRGLTWAVHGFLAFIVFNAAVVFVGGWPQVMGVVVSVVLAGLAARAVVRRPSSPERQV